MSRIETYLDYRLPDYEEAAFLLAKYFIEHNFESDVRKSKEHTGGYSTLIRRHGLFKNLIGSRTAVLVTFFPCDPPPEAALEGGKDAKAIEGGRAETEDEKSRAVEPAQNQSDNVPAVSGGSVAGSGGAGVKPDGVTGARGTAVEIHSGVMQDGLFKEILTFVLILPAVRKLYDYAQMFNLAKTQSVKICEKLYKEETEAGKKQPDEPQPPRYIDCGPDGKPLKKRRKNGGVNGGGA